MLYLVLIFDLRYVFTYITRRVQRRTPCEPRERRARSPRAWSTDAANAEMVPTTHRTCATSASIELRPRASSTSTVVVRRPPTSCLRSSPLPAASYPVLVPKPPLLDLHHNKQQQGSRSVHVDAGRCVVRRPARPATSGSGRGKPEPMPICISCVLCSACMRPRSYMHTDDAACAIDGGPPPRADDEAFSTS